MKTHPSRSRRYLLFGILALAAMVRLWGIQHDLPYSYYGDEAHFVNRALSFGSGDLNPHWFHKPAFYMYLLFVEYGAYFVVGYLLGCWSSVTEFAVDFIRNPGPFYAIGRLTTVFFGLGRIWAVYRLGERHFAKGVGLIGGVLLLTLTLGHIAASQQVKADIPATFFTIASAYFLLNYVARSDRKNLLLACLFAGMGTATKYYSIVMLVPISLSILLSWENAERRWLTIVRRKFCLEVAAIAAFLTTYFVCAPYSLLDPLGRESVLGPFAAVVERSQGLTAGGATTNPGDLINRKTMLAAGAADYVRVLCSPQGMGILIGVIGLAGVVYMGVSRSKANMLFLIGPGIITLLSVFLHPGYAEPRHQCPLYPFLALAGAALTERLARAAGSHGRFLYAALALGLCVPTFHIVQRARELSKENTYNVAKAWIEKSIPAGTKLLVSENGPKLFVCEDRLQRFLSAARKVEPDGQFTTHFATLLEYELAAAKGATTYDLYEIRFPWWRETDLVKGVHVLDSEYDHDMGNPLKPVGVEEYNFYVENGFQYAIVDSAQYASYFPKDSDKVRKFPWFAKFFHELFDRATLVQEFSPEKDGLRGPVVKIFRFER